ncbi:MAG: NAD(P)H-dependent oxidoreductase [Lachnospiraceae bacterium]|nr:NAD(P)H-dependent oxidoreductase [Lachnospiraceae bacterium]
MKVLVINGSPKGEKSITFQTCRYIYRKFPETDMHVIHVLKYSDGTEDMESAVEAVKAADLVIFSYPVYVGMAPAQLVRFIELFKGTGERFEDKYVTQITTSVHLFDITAHRYLEDNLYDMGFRVIRGLSLSTGDLLKNKGQLDVVRYWNYVVHCVNEGIYNRSFSGRENKDIPFGISVKHNDSVLSEKDPMYRILVITDCAKNDEYLRSSIVAFRHSVKYTTTVLNLHELNMESGCTGCYRCIVQGKCHIHDSVDHTLEKQLKTADAILYAFRIKDHFGGYRIKILMDRSFCSGKYDHFGKKPSGFLLLGGLTGEDNLRLFAESKMQEGKSFVTGYATGESGDMASEIDMLASNMSYALYHRLSMTPDFYGISSEKLRRDMLIYVQTTMLYHPVTTVTGMKKAQEELLSPYEKLLKERNIEEEMEFPDISIPDISMPDINLNDLSIPEIHIPEIDINKIRSAVNRMNPLSGKKN